nr:hypothetical protein [uncultured Rhodopila sp.]
MATTLAEVSETASVAVICDSTVVASAAACAAVRVPDEIARV